MEFEGSAKLPDSEDNSCKTIAPPWGRALAGSAVLIWAWSGLAGG